MKQRLKGARTPEQEQLTRTAAYSSFGIAPAIGSGYYGGVALAEELKGKQGQLVIKLRILVVVVSIDTAREPGGLRLSRRMFSTLWMSSHICSAFGVS